MRGWILLVGIMLATAPLVSHVEAQPCYTYRVVDIPTPAGEMGQTSFEGINRAGVITGRYANQDPAGGYQLMRTGKKGKLSVTPMTNNGGLETWPRAINTQRDTAGMAFDPATRQWIGYVRRHLKNPTIQRVEVPGAARTEALGMNSLRDVVGVYHVRDEATGFLGPAQGFWRYWGEYLTINAPVPDGEGTELTGINLSQDIVGWYYDSTGIHGLHIVDGVYATLDVPGAVATFLNALNDAGDIVGSYVMAIDPYGWVEVEQGFLYRAGEFFTIAPDVGETQSMAMGISATGEIVGNFIDAEGRIHGYIATPAACGGAVAQR